MVLLCALLLIADSESSPAWPASAVGASPSSSILPSAATAEFIAAYSRGDEVLADSLASPLYRAEWERRGLDAAERARIALPDHGGRRIGGAPSRERLRFDFVGGVVDSRGFGHVLYLARSALADPQPTWTVWRVDVDPEGSVIWLEMVWLFAEGTQPTRPILDPAVLTGAPLPPVPCCARPILGVVSAAGREAHSAYGLWALTPGSSADEPPTWVGFYGVDSDGRIRPGAWSFGESGNGPRVYGESRPSPRDWQLGADDRLVLDAYIESLGW